jgi:hypothetical protein
MRSEHSPEEAMPSFTLVCPGYKRSRSDSASGNLTFTIGSQVVAEIDHGDLLESWAAAEELTATESIRMSEVAAGHLSDILESGLSSSDLTAAVTDAAVVFLLALKRNGISDPKRIPACTVMWNGDGGEERVVFGA